MYELKYQEWSDRIDPTSEDYKVLRMLLLTEVEDYFTSNLSLNDLGRVVSEVGLGTNSLNNYTVSLLAYGVAKFLEKNGVKKVHLGYNSSGLIVQFAKLAAEIIKNNGVCPVLFNDPMALDDLVSRLENQAADNIIFLEVWGTK